MFKRHSPHLENLPLPRKFQENSKNFLEDNPDIMAEIDKKIRQGLGLLEEEEVAASEEE